MKKIKFIKPYTLLIDTPYGKKFTVDTEKGLEINVVEIYGNIVASTLCFTGGNMAYEVPSSVFEEIPFV